MLFGFDEWDVTPEWDVEWLGTDSSDELDFEPSIITSSSHFRAVVLVGVHRQTLNQGQRRKPNQ